MLHLKKKNIILLAMNWPFFVCLVFFTNASWSVSFQGEGEARLRGLPGPGSVLAQLDGAPRARAAGRQRRRQAGAHQGRAREGGGIGQEDGIIRVEEQGGKGGIRLEDDLIGSPCIIHRERRPLCCFSLFGYPCPPGIDFSRSQREGAGY